MDTQVLPDFYNDAKSCKQHNRNRVQTNPRYSNFRQTHFTAGDVEQFKQESKQFTDFSRICQPPFTEDIDNRWNIIKDYWKWDGYTNLGADSVDNTFHYIFNKFKKGIYIKIVNNTLDVFLPFSNKNFVNEFSYLVKIDPKFKDFQDLVRQVQTKEGRKYNPKRINNDYRKWYANNCIIRYEFPISEGDSGAVQMRDMFLNLCKHRKIPDCCFFVNRRDFPILRRDRHEAYTAIFGKTPLLSHNYPKYLPILSMTSTDENADIPIPTWDDWARVRSLTDNVFFPKACRDYHEQFNTDWETKLPVAVFRGGSTGCGLNVNTNMRLKAAYISQVVKPIHNGEVILDAGITNWNLRPRFENGVLTTLDTGDLKLSGELTPGEQSNYKYILHIDGHSSAFRLSLEMSMGSVILLCESKYYTWYRKNLKEYVHYVPVKKDLSDLESQIIWCINHDSECQKIAENAMNFYNTFLQKDGIYDYLQTLLVKLKAETGDFVFPPSIQNVQTDLVIQEIQKVYTEFIQFSAQALSTKNTVQKFQDRANVLAGIQQVVYNQLRTQQSIGIYKSNQTPITLQNTTYTPVTFLNLTDFMGIKKSTRSVVHELFTGLTSINALRLEIPNFVYTFCDYGKDAVLLEHVSGQSLWHWIQSKEFNMTEYIDILYQLALVLQVAQERCDFVHYDLYPWNIVLKTTKPRKISYNISKGKTITITTRMYPVIIDYGRVKTSYRGIIYGPENVGNFYTEAKYHDLLTILINTVHLILEKHHLKSDSSAHIITLMNFFKGNRNYTGVDKFRRITKIRKFTENAKKFSNILFQDKGNMENIKPIHFVRYIMVSFKGLDINLGEFQELGIVKGKWKWNSRQVSEYIYGVNTSTHFNSFMNVLYQFKKCSKLPQSDNGFIQASCYQSFQVSLMNLKSSFDQQSFSKNYQRKFNSLYQNSLKLLDQIYRKNLATNIVLFPFTNSKFVLDISTYQNPEVMEKMLSKYKLKHFYRDFHEIYTQITNLLYTDTSNLLTSSQKEEYRQVFRDFLKGDAGDLQLHTYRVISKHMVYKILREFEKVECKNQELVHKYQKIYQQLI